jgi:hypothetical protein
MLPGTRTRPGARSLILSDNEHAQCPPSRRRLRRLVRTIRPPLPRSRYEATQAPVCRQLPRSPFRNSHLSLPLIIFHPSSRRCYPNLDPALNNALITASLHPVFPVAPLHMLSPAALRSSPQLLPPSRSRPESLPPTPPSPTLYLRPAPPSPFFSSPPFSLLPACCRRCLHWQSAAVFRPGSSPSPVLISVSSPLALAALSPGPKPSPPHRDV